MPCRKTKSNELDDVQKAILKVLSEIDHPAACKEIAEKAGLPTPKVTGKLRGLKTRGLVESPEKGKYIITEKGKKAI